MRAFVYFTDGMPLLGFRRRRLAGTAAALTMSLVLGLMLATVAVAAKGPITHSVIAGGPDACRSVFDVHPGCDGNYSLTAIQYADGSVSGQYIDRFGKFGGLHAVIDCLYVDGPDAWVSGVVTSGFFKDPDTGEVFDLAGLPIATKLHDGTPVGEPDQTGFSLLDENAFPCTDHPDDVPQFDVTEGQVIVR
jgi:hypothetical protein